MEINHVYIVLVLAFMVTLAHSESRAEELARRQFELTTEIFDFVESRLRVQQGMLEERIRRLEDRVVGLEARPVIPPGGGGGEGTDGEAGGKEPAEVVPEQPVTEARTTMKPTTVRATTVAPTTLRSVPQYDATCAQIYNNGYTTSGDYTIDPDGFGSNAPYTVYCDMDNGEGITVVGHDSEDANIPVNGFEAPGSFILEPTYVNSVTMRQLGALADASLECKQFVKYNCKNSGLMEIDRKSGQTYAWWVDRYGVKHVNFGGAATDSEMCACGVTNSCFQGSPTCNCDHNKAKNQIDEGFFDDKTVLPVQTLNLGDTGSKKERGAVTLGKFICKG